MRRRFAFLFALLLPLLSAGWGQEQHNFLAVNGQVLDTSIGPYYFIAQGNHTDAFARAQLLAAAMGAEVVYDTERELLIFTRGAIRATLRTTADIAAGLVKQPDAIQAGGRSLDSPLGIRLGGTSYVAIGPIVDALGGASAWFAEARVVTVETQPYLSTPRIGQPDGGRTRVALDLPVNQSYAIAAGGQKMIVSFPEASAPDFERSFPDDANLRRVGLHATGGLITLEIDTAYPLSPDGSGYRIGTLPHPDRTTLYIDFAPDLRGEKVAALTADGPLPTALPAPDAPRPVIVLDAGHGGRFMGAHGFAIEEVVVLAIALKIQVQLEAEGVDVILTRDGDYHLSSDYGSDLAARAAYATPDRNLFVSIHANAVEDERAHGIETFVFGRPLDESLIAVAIKENGGGELGRALTEEALELADDPTAVILRETQLTYSRTLAQLVQERLVETTGSRDRGVKQNALFVLRNARTPAILIEVGFVSHPEEGQRLATDAYQTTLANAIADGILTFLHNGGTVASR